MRFCTTHRACEWRDEICGVVKAAETWGFEVGSELVYNCTLVDALIVENLDDVESVRQAMATLIENGTNYTVRCLSCEIAGCHRGALGGHDGPGNPPVHDRDVWVYAGFTDDALERAEQ